MPVTAASTLPFTSILVPTLDEAQYIGACLESLLAQEPGGGFEILVLDGGSTDGTREIVERIAASSRVPVHLLHNPGRVQSAACNLGARKAEPKASVLLRADAHAVYPPTFLVNCVGALLEHGATSVVVPMDTVPEDEGHRLQRAIAATQNSRLGNGGAAHRHGGAAGWVDHGHHAAFDRGAYEVLGGYDPWFSPNEDAEFDHRAVTSGGRVWLCPEAEVTYHPRRTLRTLAGQYSRHGAGRARTVLFHGVRPKVRQCAPLAVLGGCVGGVALSPLRREFLLIPLAYAAACLGWGATEAARRRDPWLVLMGPAAATIHLSWAVGFTRTALAWPRVRRTHPPASELP